MNVQPTKAQVTLIARHPVAYMLALALILLGIFISKVFSISDEQLQQCELRTKAAEQRAERAEARAQVADREKFELAEKLLVSTTVLKTIQQETDSVVRRTAGRKAKSILKKQIQ